MRMHMTCSAYRHARVLYNHNKNTVFVLFKTNSLPNFAALQSRAVCINPTLFKQNCLMLLPSCLFVFSALQMNVYVHRIIVFVYKVTLATTGLACIIQQFQQFLLIDMNMECFDKVIIHNIFQKRKGKSFPFLV